MNFRSRHPIFVRAAPKRFFTPAPGLGSVVAQTSKSAGSRDILVPWFQRFVTAALERCVGAPQRRKSRQNPQARKPALRYRCQIARVARCFWTQFLTVVGTSRGDVTTRAEQAERGRNASSWSCAANCGEDGAARRPYRGFWIHPFQLLFAALLLFGASRLFARDSLFMDLPTYQAATNILRTSMATNAVTGSTNAAAALSGGTNFVALPSTNAMAALDNQYHLAIGDRLSFQIKEDRDAPKLLTVMDSGDLEVPYVGRYPAAGKTCKQLAYELKAILEKEYYYRATVIISVDLKAKSRGKVYLVGAVRMPGPQDIPNDPNNETFTLSKAVMRAGGFTDFADGRHVQVTRSVPGRGEKTYTVNVQQVLQDGKIDSDMKLEPGDLIYVPEKLVHF